MAIANSRPEGQVPTLQQRHQRPEQCRRDRGADAAPHHRVDVEIDAEGHRRAVSPVQTSFRKPKSAGIPIGPEGDDRQQREQRQQRGARPTGPAAAAAPAAGSRVAGDGSSKCCGEAMVANAAGYPAFLRPNAAVAPACSGVAALPSFSMTSAAAGTSGLTPEQISAIDAAHLWHPYSTIGAEGGAPGGGGRRPRRLAHAGPRRQAG